VPPGLARYTRALVVTGISVVLFLWCIIAAYPQDNDRLFVQLHAAHQGPKYLEAVESLRKSGNGSLNRCSACHADPGPIGMLVFERPRVTDEACERCHKPNQATGRAFVALEEKDARLGRPAHQGKPSSKDGKESGISGKVVGLAATADGSLSVNLSCGECHPDHLGKDFVQHVQAPTNPKGAIDTGDDKLPKQDHPFIDKPCFACHLPEGSAGQAAEVIKEMMSAHETAFEQALKQKTIPEFKEAMGKQPNVWERSCTPACHGEHARQLNDEDPS